MITQARLAEIRDSLRGVGHEHVGHELVAEVERLLETLRVIVPEIGIFDPALSTDEEIEHIALEAVRRHIRSFEPGTLCGSELNVAHELAALDGDIWAPWCVAGELIAENEIVAATRAEAEQEKYKALESYAWVLTRFWNHYSLQLLSPHGEEVEPLPKFYGRSAEEVFQNALAAVIQSK